jgi:hypothetical protein
MVMAIPAERLFVVINCALAGAAETHARPARAAQPNILINASHWLLDRLLLAGRQA